jgi:MFS transporter, ACS family, tartrate transporter
VAIPLSVVFMASASGYLLDLNGRLGITGWQWMFLIEAVPAVLLGTLVFAVLPDGPADARWLSNDERAFVVEQLSAESDEMVDSCRTTILETFRDQRVWQLAAFLFANAVAAYAYSFTAPLLIKEITGYNNKTVGFIVAGISLIGAAAILTNGRIASSKSRTYACLILSGVLIVLGCLGIGLLQAPSLIIFSLALLPTFHNANFPPLYSLAASFLAKRGAAGGLALINSVGIIGGFVGSYYVGLAKDFLGSYQRGFLTISVLCFVGTVLVIRLGKQATV